MFSLKESLFGRIKDNCTHDTISSSKKVADVSSRSEVLVAPKNLEVIETDPNSSGTEDSDSNSYDSEASSIPEIPEPQSNSIKDPDLTGFQVRGPTYNQDKLKVGISKTMLELLGVEMYQAENKDDLNNISGRGGSLIDKLKSSQEEFREVFAVNIIIAGSPLISIVTYYVRRGGNSVAEELSFDKLWEQFYYGTDDYRNKRLKLLPIVPSGPWIVRKSVGKRPLIVSNALNVQYFSGESYLEAVVDTTSDSIANKVTALCRHHVKSLTIDIGFIIEAKDDEELPECMLGCARYKNLDLENAEKL